MPHEHQRRGRKHAEKRRLEREEEERKYLASQERDVLFYDRPKHPFGMLTREDEKFFGEVYEVFKKNQWDDEDAKEAFMKNVFVEMRGKELRIATNPVGRFLELMLAHSSKSEIQRLMIAFKGHALELAKHRLGSFTLEKLSGHVGIWISKDMEGTATNDLESQHMESLEKLFVGFAEVYLSPFRADDRNFSGQK